MRIVVVGGESVIGSTLTAALRRAGHDAVGASVELRCAAGCGEQLAGTFSGAAVVVDLIGPPSREGQAEVELLAASTQSILGREATAGVRHHVLLSAVAAEQFSERDSWRWQLAHESLVKASPIAHSIVRSTLLFESLATLADVSTHGTTVHVPSLPVQAVAADDVVRVLAAVALAAPLNGTIEVGGPEPFFLDELVQRVLGARADERTVVVDVHAPYFGMRPGERSLLAGDEAELGEIRFDDWLRRTTDVSPVISIEHPPLNANEFRVSDVPPGSVWLMGDTAVFSVPGGFCATQATCTHRAGPLSQGTVDGTTVTCPLHGSQFNIWTGVVLRGPATVPLKTFRVVVDGDVGRVEADTAASQPAAQQT